MTGVTGWADVTSAVAGALVFIVGALLPHFVDAADRLLDRMGGTGKVASPAADPASASPGPLPEVPGPPPPPPPPSS